MGASMRPRGQTPWMRPPRPRPRTGRGCFNEATGADPVDAAARLPGVRLHARFNEATGADPVDAAWGNPLINESPALQ